MLKMYDSSFNLKLVYVYNVKINYKSFNHFSSTNHKKHGKHIF